MKYCYFINYWPGSALRRACSAQRTCTCTTIQYSNTMYCCTVQYWCLVLLYTTLSGQKSTSLMIRETNNPEWLPVCFIKFIRLLSSAFEIKIIWLETKPFKQVQQDKKWKRKWGKCNLTQYRYPVGTIRDEIWSLPKRRKTRFWKPSYANLPKNEIHLYLVINITTKWCKKEEFLQSEEDFYPWIICFLD